MINGIRNVSDPLRSRIRVKVVSLAAESGNPDAVIADDVIIPETGLLSSASIIELIMWLEEEFNISIEEDDITIDRLGSIELIARFVGDRADDRHP